MLVVVVFIKWFILKMGLFGRYVAVFLAGTMSMFAGATVVHRILKPDLTLPDPSTLTVEVGESDRVK